MSKLLPCPFCGEVPEIVDAYNVSCKGFLCPMNGKSAYWESWNRRHPEAPSSDALRDVVDVLERVMHWEHDMERGETAFSYFPGTDVKKAIAALRVAPPQEGKPAESTHPIYACMECERKFTNTNDATMHTVEFRHHVQPSSGEGGGNAT